MVSNFCSVFLGTDTISPTVFQNLYFYNYSRKIGVLSVWVFSRDLLKLCSSRQNQTLKKVSAAKLEIGQLNK